MTRCFTLFIFTLIAASADAQKTNKQMENTMNTIPADEIKNYRNFFDQLGKTYASAKDVEISQTEIKGLRCYWFKPSAIRSENIVVYLHGGSFALGSIESHRAMVSHIASTLGSRILFVEYGLAPENPYPGGINDVMKIYEYLLSQNKKQKIILIGDSAGAGILISVMESIWKQNVKQPERIVLLSPWLNLECTGASYEINKNNDPILTRDELKRFAFAYAGTNLRKADPSKMSFVKYPPTLVLVGSTEILLSDSEDFIKKIRDHQPKTTLSVYPNQNHVWLLTNIYSEESKRALNEIERFINE